LGHAGRAGGKEKRKGRAGGGGGGGGGGGEVMISEFVKGLPANTEQASAVMV